MSKMTMHLPAVWQMLNEIIHNAHAPYSKFKVACVIVDSFWNLHGGVNVENAAYPQGWCAEASAIASMVTCNGGIRIHEVHTMAENVTKVPPCGGCRQKIQEFVTDDCKVYMWKYDWGNNEGTYEVIPFAELYPHQFDASQLRVVDLSDSQSSV